MVWLFCGAQNIVKRRKVKQKKINMANLVKNGDVYESAAVAVSGDFNIHVECENVALVDLAVKTAGSKYQVKYSACDATIDEDFSILVAKSIKIISNQPGTYVVTNA